MTCNRTIRTLRRLLLWTVICTVNAAPSFIWAMEKYNHVAMAVGVILFIAAYTISTSTDAFERFHARPFVRTTLYWGYGLRLFLSVVYPLGMAADVIPGMISIELVARLGFTPTDFGGTLATTIVQGTLLNVIISLFMLFIWSMQRAFRKQPDNLRGFEVIMPTNGGNQPVDRNESPRQ